MVRKPSRIIKPTLIKLTLVDKRLRHKVGGLTVEHPILLA